MVDEPWNQTKKTKPNKPNLIGTTIPGSSWPEFNGNEWF